MFSFKHIPKKFNSNFICLRKLLRSKKMNRSITRFGKRHVFASGPIPPATTTATTRAAAGPLNNNAGSMSAACSNSGEFRTPSDCSSANQTFNCDFFVRWELTNGDQIVFTMKVKNFWMQAFCDDILS